MNDTFLQPYPSSRRRPPISRLVSIAAVSLIAGLFMLMFVKHRREAERTGAQELTAALADADRLDPGWRLEEIEAQRPALADDANSARCIEAVAALLPRNWPRDASTLRLSAHPAIDPLPPEMMTILRRELSRAGPAIAEARKLEQLPKGRFRIAWKPDYAWTPGDALSTVRRCNELLQWESCRLIEDGDIDGALARCRAILNGARSLDGPHGGMQLVRVAQRSVAVGTVQRALATAVPTPVALLACQCALGEEDSYPVHLMIRRAERLWMYHLLKEVAEGATTWSHYQRSSGFFVESDAPPDADMADMARTFRGRALKAENQFVEIAKRPLHEQRPLLEHQRKTVLAELPERARDLVSDPTKLKLLETCQRNQATLRCAIIALAAERFRLQTGRWPMSLADLTPDLLEAVPLDPFDGEPLRFRRLDDGVAIYSVGPDGGGDGSKVGNVDNWSVVERGVGFRLWDEDRRRFRKKAAGDP